MSMIRGAGITQRDRGVSAPTNPFTPRAPVPSEMFVGRERELDLLFGHIGAHQRGSVAISGDHGTGKTSLLLQVARDGVARAHGAEGVDRLYIDMQAVAPFSGHRFWRRVARAATGTGSEPSLVAPAETLRSRPNIDLYDVEEFLDTLAESGRGLVLLLDEFEWAVAGDTSESRDFLAQMASLARRSPRVLALVVATHRPLHEVIRRLTDWRGSPFPTVFTSVPLPVLSRGDCQHLLELAAERGAPVQAGDIDLIFDLASGVPALVQSAAFALVRGRMARRGDLDLVRAIEAAVDEARATLTTDPEAPPAVEGLTVRQRAVEESGPRPDHRRAQRQEQGVAGSGTGTGASARSQVAVAGATDDHESKGAGHDGVGLSLDTASGEVRVNGDLVPSLTALEFNLLKLLCQQPGRLLSKEQIIRDLWGDDAHADIEPARVEKLISRLRRKVEPMPSRPQFLRTVRGRGYRFAP